MDGWRRSDLNQREYCEANGLSLKSFGNWRAQLNYEDTVTDRKARWRRRPKLGPMTSPMTNPMTEETEPPLLEATAPPLVVARSGRRRRFSEAAKRQIVEETCRPGATVSGVARRYGIAVSVLFRWKHALGLGASHEEPAFLPVRIEDGNEATVGQPSVDLQLASVSPPSLIIERATPGIEFELIGGRRVRFDRDVDPDTVRRLVSALEGDSP